MSYISYENWRDNPVNKEPYLSIVIPAYNESVRIIPTIGAIASYVSGVVSSWELIVADDGSTDGTVGMINDLNLANVSVLVTDRNGGKGRAVQRGMLAASGKYILFADADNSTPIEELGKLLHKLELKDFDVAVGSRAADGAEEANRSPMRRLMSGTLRGIVKHLFKIGVKDTQCGFKMFTHEAAQKLYRTQTIMGFSFDLEILYLAQKFGFRIAEIPVAWIDAPGSKVDSFKEARRFLRDLVRIRVNDWRKVYDIQPIVDDTQPDYQISQEVSIS
jgi:dolichyl-phosphate beta-glucosyltransferase